MKKLKIAVAVHGRYTAFDLTHALLAEGHDVTLLTNYPRWAVKRFGLPPEIVRSCWQHGVTGRLRLGLMRHRWFSCLGESVSIERHLHCWFGRWVARMLRGQNWDLVYAFSGVAEEAFAQRYAPHTMRLLMRASAHIRVQERLLREEALRTGDTHGSRERWAWNIGREEREYALADKVNVISSFALRTFLEQNVPAEKLALIPCGTPVERFTPAAEVIHERRARLDRNEKLRVLFVGPLTWQKGLWDLIEIMDQLRNEPFEFRLVGPQDEQVMQVLRARGLDHCAVGKFPERELPEQAYRWGDVFLFPTIQDGFAIVIAQALASVLPVIVSAHSGGPDVVRAGENGWVLPPRTPQQYIERLRWCQANRSEVARMVDDMQHDNSARTWTDVAQETVECYSRWLAEKQTKPIKPASMQTAHGRKNV